MGVVLYAMLAGHLPFENTDTRILYKKILKADYIKPTGISDEAKNMINTIFTVIP